MPKSVTKEQIESLIQQAEYIRPESAPTLTICVLTLANGFSVRGEDACADPALFNEEIGQRYAYEDAFRKIWQLEGYLLRQRMFIEAQAAKGNPISLADFIGDEKLADLVKLRDQ